MISLHTDRRLAIHVLVELGCRKVDCQHLFFDLSIVSI